MTEKVVDTDPQLIVWSMKEGKITEINYSGKLWIPKPEKRTVADTTIGRICSNCRKDKPLTEFATNTGRPSGHQSMCRDCYKEYNRPKHPIETPLTKVCTQCKTEKPSDQFYSDRTKKDGLCCECKECKREHNKISSTKYREKHREKNTRKISEGELPLTTSSTKDRRSIKDHWPLFKLNKK
ncbi:MAG: hypothetical protein KAS32_13815 [Candidatus Peribacteraceae bacterium]|nr:hypothetical protein [Candidatus Peribacteraceae bacterium]